MRPAVFRSLIPPAFPRPDDWVRVSGVVEGVAGVGLLTARPWAGRLAAAVLGVIWVGNVQSVLDAGSGRQPGLLDRRAVAWARLPLQAPLIWAALQSRPRRR